MRIVFLDIDGVIVNRASLKRASGHYAMGDSGCVRQLNRITRETGSQIVVTSTWRKSFVLPQLQRIFIGWGVSSSIVGVTPVLDKLIPPGDVFGAARRGDEIQRFMDGYPSVERFIILDDEDCTPHNERLIKTKFEFGLTEQDADAAIALMLT